MSDNARTRASNKYNKANYKQFKANLKLNEYDLIKDFLSKNDLSNREFLLKAMNILSKDKPE